MTQTQTRKPAAPSITALSDETEIRCYFCGVKLFDFCGEWLATVGEDSAVCDARDPLLEGPCRGEVPGWLPHSADVMRGAGA
jgi:hypothetical protein